MLFHDRFWAHLVKKCFKVDYTWKSWIVLHFQRTSTTVQNLLKSSIGPTGH